MTNAVAAIEPILAAVTPLQDAATTLGATTESGVTTRLSLSDLLQHQSARLESTSSSRSSDPAMIADRILESIDSMRKDYQQLLGKAEQMLESGPASNPLAVGGPATIVRDGAAGQGPVEPHQVAAAEIREMLAVQLDMGRLMVHEQLVSSTAGKSNQNLDTLLRGQ